MSDRATIVWNIDATQAQRPTRFEAVCVVPDADAKVGRGRVLRGLAQ
jgi:hypothetical protein